MQEHYRLYEIIYAALTGQPLPKPQSRLEEMVEAYITGEKWDKSCLSRIEEMLKAALFEKNLFNDDKIEKEDAKIVTAQNLWIYNSGISSTFRIKVEPLSTYDLVLTESHTIFRTALDSSGKVPGKDSIKVTKAVEHAKNTFATITTAADTKYMVIQINRERFAQIAESLRVEKVFKPQSRIEEIINAKIKGETYEKKLETDIEELLAQFLGVV